jgi:crotonobetainyl-CoA:carnitine CoA-transferase CaiB-like acyl-CoA transferase
MQAASGIAGLFRAVDGAPRYAPINICDRVVGLYVANAVTSALYHRAMTGEGQAIEVPMFETMTQFVLADHMGGGAFAPPLGAMGYKRLLSRTRGPYATKDGHLSLVVYTDRHWRDFTQLVGCPDLMDRDERFRSQESRTRYAEDIGRFLADQLPARSNKEWLEALHGIDIPACPVNAIEDLFEDPHLKAVGFFEEMDHPTEGKVWSAATPCNTAVRRPRSGGLAPNLGEHTAEILGIIELLRPGFCAAAQPPGDGGTGPAQAATVCISRRRQTSVRRAAAASNFGSIREVGPATVAI